ncbi:MAG: 23S rRNA (pseudouridine(1915)-N(3))-methyltransferase RlmH [Pseudohongiellaceae bacterium]
MKITLIAVGNKVPDWVDAGVADYAKRLPRDFRLDIRPVPLAVRTRTANIEQCIKKESEGILRLIKPDDHAVALDERGRRFTTMELAGRFDALRADGINIVLIAGGPDGLDESCLGRADETWSLSALTFPHPLVRIVVAEQLYRVWTVLNGHPYHRM